MSKNANKPVNPAPYVIREDGSISNPTYAGLTKREYFAGLAMQGLLSNPEIKDSKALAKFSIEAADALLNELDK